MSGELATAAAEVMPYLTAAVSAYGGAVLSRASDDAADATVGLGRRLAQRIFGTRQHDDPVPEPLADLIADPADPDVTAALRLAVRKALAADPQLAADITGLLATAPVVTITASGERAVAAQTITGSTIVTGSHNDLAR